MCPWPRTDNGRRFTMLRQTGGSKEISETQISEWVSTDPITQSSPCKAPCVALLGQHFRLKCIIEHTWNPSQARIADLIVRYN